MLLSTDPRKVRIEVGYGLEPILTDALSSLILETRILPRLRAHDVAGGLSAGTSAIIAATGGAAEPAASPAAFHAPSAPRPPAESGEANRKRAHDLRIVITLFSAMFAFFLLLAIWFVWITRRESCRARMIGPRRPATSGASDWSSGDGYGSSSSSSDSGGGFDSGGGSSGGGGADSSW